MDGTDVAVAGSAGVLDQPASSLTANEIDPNINCFCPSDESRLYISSMINLIIQLRITLIIILLVLNNLPTNSFWHSCH